ncbi:uncharacterized protein LOC116203674 isoform X1 [Punica granatum]|uniref:Uncharacterized protein LOC116203674 isoform X1 n=1 Tax=Punica granatum TaxID=22663 RepID=A0A218XHI8_PUNGR|nr:uncharacterized protein LOC116203674 isoform X1 [Punica granatum]OWM83921.1 hypothetical protein CDL15_Pgr004352 [Punica granatum]
MAPPPGPYSGKSTLALVARASAFSVGLVYGSIKLKYLKVKDLLLDGPRRSRKGKQKQRHTTEPGNC